VSTILIVEDEKEIRRFLRMALEGEGFRVVDAETLSRGLIEAATRKPELVILDLGLPDGDGTEFIRDMRQWSNIPVIVLSARSDEQDKITALDAGADDFLTKPFGVGELMARVRVALRHRPQQGNDSVDAPINIGSVTVDIAARRVMRDGADLHLTPIELRLLGSLINHPGKVMTQRQLLTQVGGPIAVEHSHYLRIYMGHLRHKIDRDPARPQHLLTETGVGYRFMP